MAKLSLFVGSGDLIKVGCGWLWVMGENYSWSLVVAVKLWLVVGGGCKGMPFVGGRGSWRQNYGRSYGWLQVVEDNHGLP